MDAAPPITVELVPGEHNGSASTSTDLRTVQIVTHITDYLYRGAALSHLSPMLLYVFYYKRRLHPNEGTPPRPLHPDHPQASTHTWVRRLHFAAPQPISNAPVRRTGPITEGDTARDMYAAFAHDNFAA